MVDRMSTDTETTKCYSSSSSTQSVEWCEFHCRSKRECTLLSRVEAAEKRAAEGARGWEALLLYARHYESCDGTIGADDCCECGLSDVLIEARGHAPEARENDYASDAVLIGALRRRAEEAERKLAVVQTHYTALESQNFDLTHQVADLQSRELTEEAARKLADDVVRFALVERNSSTPLTERVLKAILSARGSR